MEGARCTLTRHGEGLALRVELSVLQGAHMRIEVTTGNDVVACRLEPGDVGEQVIIGGVAALLLVRDVHIAQDQLPGTNGELQPDGVGRKFCDPKLQLTVEVAAHINCQAMAWLGVLSTAAIRIMGMTAAEGAMKGVF